LSLHDQDADFAAIGAGSEGEGRVFFAGEHTLHQYRGTVHGAYLSGLRAAKQIIRALDKSASSTLTASGTQHPTPHFLATIVLDLDKFLNCFVCWLQILIIVIIVLNLSLLFLFARISVRCHHDRSHVLDSMICLLRDPDNFAV
jgi:hypothetical protein